MVITPSLPLQKGRGNYYGKNSFSFPEQEIAPVCQLFLYLYFFPLDLRASFTLCKTTASSLCLCVDSGLKRNAPQCIMCPW